MQKSVTASAFDTKLLSELNLIFNLWGLIKIFSKGNPFTSKIIMP